MSRLTRTLIIGAALGAMTLAGTTAVVRAQATDQPAGKQAVLHPPNAKSASPGATARPHPRSRPPRTPPSSGYWPESTSPSPAGHPPRCRPRRLPSPVVRPAG